MADHNDRQASVRDFWDSLATQSGESAAIDPRDRRGDKNAYIATVRDLAILSTLDTLGSPRCLLDFGTGTGTLLSTLNSVFPDALSIGTDISRLMLQQAIVRDRQLYGGVFQCDGAALPLQDGSVDVITTGGVLLYLGTDDVLGDICRSFFRAVREGGAVICVEQVRGSRYFDTTNMKVQRTPEEIIGQFEAAGFACQSWRQIRRGRFPLVYAIRYGLLPRSAHRQVALLEARLWREAKLPRIDYADAIFEFRKLEA